MALEIERKFLVKEGKLLDKFRETLGIESIRPEGDDNGTG